MTVCAGKLTPHAKVAVETKSYICFAPNRSSTNAQSHQSSPAWWIPIPNSIRSFKSWLTQFYLSPYKTSLVKEESLRNLWSVSLANAISLIL